MRIADYLLTVAREHNVPARPRVLDFGCGDAAMVLELRRRGFDAAGTDIERFWQRSDSALRVAELDPYRLPFPDGNFDLVLSNQVLEHVADIDAVFRELRRVMRPGAVAVHLYPSPWRLPVEPHIYVPLGTMLQARLWLALWAWLGVRNEYQRGLPWRDVLQRNIAYCRSSLHYRSPATMRRAALRHFPRVTFARRTRGRLPHWLAFPFREQTLVTHA